MKKKDKSEPLDFKSKSLDYSEINKLIEKVVREVLENGAEKK